MNSFKLSSKRQKWQLVIKIIPILFFILLLKLIFRKYNMEYINLNALFTSLIAGTIFLIGFLINGVISDYKESERIPGDMASSLEIIYDEISILNKNRDNEIVKEFFRYYKEFLNSLGLWFYKKERTKNMIEKLHKMNDYFAELESIMQIGPLLRMKNEQGNLRKMIIRIDYIRDTSFIQSAYAIVEILALFLIGGLLILKIEPFYESIFFTLLVSFLMVYMILLIKDLDNPFDYATQGENGTEVSLKPIHDFTSRVNKE